MVRIYDRNTNEYYNEVQYGEKKLEFLYDTLIGRILLRLFISKFFSQITAKLNSGKRSVKKIRPFIEKYSIKTDDFEKKVYTSFDDFFTRKLKNGKQTVCNDMLRLISPCDSKLSVYRIDSNLVLNIKNSLYTIDELLKDKHIANMFADGICLVFRLTVDDYHRYCFVDSGNIINHKVINGKLHTVSSISNRYKVFKENQREYQVIETDHLGTIVQMEVGAILVGKIVNHPVPCAVRGEEKGYFNYGGSTIILLIEKSKVQIDSDIMQHSKDNIETKVRYGEGVGDILC